MLFSYVCVSSQLKQILYTLHLPFLLDVLCHANTQCTNPCGICGLRLPVFVMDLSLVTKCKQGVGG